MLAPARGQEVRKFFSMEPSYFTPGGRGGYATAYRSFPAVSQTMSYCLHNIRMVFDHNVQHFVGPLLPVTTDIVSPREDIAVGKW
jgi:hypothetical protein